MGLLSADAFRKFQELCNLDIFDTNGDGFITREELLTMFNGLALEVDPGFQLVVDEMIKVADVNGDGKIDFNEFLAMASAN